MTTVYRDNAAKPITNRSELLPVVMVVGLALALRLCQLGAESLWIDEGFSLRDATRLNMLKETRPLYFLILAGWLDSDWAATSSCSGCRVCCSARRQSGSFTRSAAD